MIWWDPILSGGIWTIEILSETAAVTHPQSPSRESSPLGNLDARPQLVATIRGSFKAVILLARISVTNFS